MLKEDIDLLVDQLRTILLNKPLSREKKTQAPELAVLQEGIFYLSDCLAEVNEFLHHLQIGELDVTPPGRHNYLAGSLKELHSALQHLTWQANQVANGDYSQSVNFLGDFSTSFNQMIHQLAERESRLKVQSQMLTESVERMKSVMDGLKDWIIVTLQDTGDVVYANQSARQFFFDPAPGHRNCKGYHEFLDYIRRCGQFLDECHTFEYRCCQTRRTFRIRAYEIRWSEKMACAHIITDVTTEQEYREQMEGFAYEDELTGLHNRRFCLENLEKLIAEGTEFTFCMIDLDGLKYANDNFGHGAGDEYLRTVSRQLLQSSRSSDLICRIGGDEFVAVFPNCKSQVVLEKMEQLDRALAEHSQRFPMSASYGMVHISGNEAMSVQSVMAQADEQMYVLKNIKKASRRGFGGLVVSFAWSKELETGNVQIDAEHQELLRAINRLLEACATGKGEEELNDTVDFLTQYTITHFHHEEALQVQYDYPDYPNHKHFHETFFKVVDGLATKLKAEGATPRLMEDMNKQLAGWLLNHIRTEDAKVAKHIQNCQSRSQEPTGSALP